jgi:hypothetical protein
VTVDNSSEQKERGRKRERVHKMMVEGDAAERLL